MKTRTPIGGFMKKIWWEISPCKDYRIEGYRLKNVHAKISDRGILVEEIEDFHEENIDWEIFRRNFTKKSD